MPHINVMDKFQWEGNQICEIFVCFFVGRVIASRVGGWCRVIKGGSPGALIFILLIWWSHADMVLSGCTHVDMVWQ